MTIPTLASIEVFIVAVYRSLVTEYVAIPLINAPIPIFTALSMTSIIDVGIDPSLLFC